MHQVLDEARSNLGLDLEHLAAAASHTQQTIEDARNEVTRYLDQALSGFNTSLGLDLVAFGSMARDEMSPGSDFDYLVIANKILPNPAHVQTFRQAAQSALNAIGAPRPGASGLFGGMIGAPGLVNQVGLEEDTNKSLSRRILVLEESICLNKYDHHDALVSSILERYLFDYQGSVEPRVPRFLFNDVSRFWHTIAVDYQAKRWQELTAEKWGLRYIKLRSSRKWTFAGSVVSLFMPVLSQKPTTSMYLRDQFRMPPLARIAQLHSLATPHGPTAKAVSEVLRIANEFQGWNWEPEWRNTIAKVRDPTSDNLAPEFTRARQRTHDLQTALEALFFSDEALGPKRISMQELTKKYKTF